MRENIRLKQQPFQLSLNVKKAGIALAAALLVVGAAFALGLGVGRKSSDAPAQPAGLSGDALARLDEPLAPKEEAPPELKAHQALTDSRSIDKTMPVPSVTAVAKTAAPAPRADEKAVGEQEIVMPPPIAAPGPAPLPAAAASSLPSSPSNSPAASAGQSPQPRDPAADRNRDQPSTSTKTAPPAVASALRTGSRSQDAGATGDRRHASKAKHAAAQRSAALRSKAKGKGAYTIQIAAAHTRVDAERVAKRVAARRPRIVAADVPGKGRWYRVQIGSYDTRESARVALLSMPGVHGVVTPAR